MSPHSVDNPVCIIQITDMHILEEPGKKFRGINTEESFRNTLENALISYPHADLIIVTGDLAEEPCKSSYQRIHDELAKKNIRCLCLPGNHDDFGLMQQILNQKTINCDKQIIFGNWQIIMLNSQIPGKEGGYLKKTELDYLERRLKNCSLNTLIAVHHQCVPSKSRWLDTMQIENSDQLFELLSKYPGVCGITFGHIHQPIKTRKNDIIVLGTPSTCFQFKSRSQDFALDVTPPAYRWLNLFPDGRIESQVEYLNKS